MLLERISNGAFVTANELVYLHTVILDLERFLVSIQNAIRFFVLNPREITKKNSKFHLTIVSSTNKIAT